MFHALDCWFITSFKILRPLAAFYSQPLAFCSLALICRLFCSGESGLHYLLYENLRIPSPSCLRTCLVSLRLRRPCALPPPKKKKTKDKILGTPLSCSLVTVFVTSCTLPGNYRLLVPCNFLSLLFMRSFWHTKTEHRQCIFSVAWACEVSKRSFYTLVPWRSGLVKPGSYCERWRHRRGLCAVNGAK